MKSKTSLVVLVIMAMLLGVFIQDIEQFCLLKLQFLWSLSFFLPKILLFLILVFSLILNFKTFKITKISLFVAVFFLSTFGIAFYQSPIYQGDFANDGKPVEEEISLTALEELSVKEPEFKGVFLMASPDCEHCHQAAKQLKMLKLREPNIDVSVLLYSRDTTNIKAFKKQTGLTSCNYYLAKEEECVLMLNHGAFPCYFYIEDQKIVKRWFPEACGYPAFDEMESM